MAASGGRNEITTRISLTGDGEIKIKLKELGQAGEKALRDINVATASSSGAFAKISAGVASLKTSFAGLKDTVTPIGTSVRDFGGHTDFLRTRLVALVAALGVTGGAFGVFRSALKGITSTDELGDTADTLGITTDQLVALRTLAAGTGGDADTFVKSLGKMNVASREAAEKAGGLTTQLKDQTAVMRGGVTASDAFAGSMQVLKGGAADLASSFQSSVSVLRGSSQLSLDGANAFETIAKVAGKSVKDIDALDTVERFKLIADSIGKITSTTKQNSLANEIFGKSWRDVAVILKEGGAELDRLVAESNKFKLGVPKVEGDNTDQFLKDQAAALRDLDAAQRAVSTALASAFSPALRAFSDLVKANLGTIREWSASISSEATPAIGDLIKLMQGLGREKLETGFARGLIDSFETARSVVIGVVAAIKGLVAAVDLAVKPVNALFGTQFRGDALLAAAAVLRMVGAVALLTTGIGLATKAFKGFALLLPLLRFGGGFGVLTAGFAGLAAFFLKDTEAGKKFIDQLTGGGEKAADALAGVPTQIAEAGKAADGAGGSIDELLRSAENAGQVARATAGNFELIGEAGKKAAAQFPAMQRGIQNAGDAAEVAKSKFVQLTDTAKQAQVAVSKISQNTPLSTKSDTAASRGFFKDTGGPREGPETDNALNLDPGGNLGPDGKLLTAGQALARDLADAKDSISQSLRDINADLDNFVDDIEGERVPLPKFIDGWIDGAKERLAELRKLMPLGSDPSFVGSAGLLDNAPDTGGFAKFASGAAQRIADAFKDLPIGGDPQFLGSWGQAVDQFGADASRGLTDDFTNLNVPAEPGFLSAWRSSFSTWLTGQVNEIKSAFSNISIPSPISSAQAGTLGPTTGAGIGAAALGDTGPDTGSLDSITGKLSDAKSALTDFVSGIPGAISDALNSISDLIAQAVEQSTQFLSDKTDALNDFFGVALDSLSTLIGEAIAALSDGMASAFESLQGTVSSVFDWITSQIASISDLLSSLLDTASSVAAFLGGASDAGGNLEGFATGGHIKGAGSETSDSILARLSHNEFVTKAAAVRHYGVGVFHMLNEMKLPRELFANFSLPKFAGGGLAASLAVAPIMPSLPAFASGGLVNIAPAAAGAASGSGKTPVIIQLQDGSQHPMLADDDVAEALLRKRRQAGMLRG